MNVWTVDCRVFIRLVYIGLLKDFIVMNVVMKQSFIGMMMNNFV
jgi:hypothetical protein